MMPPKSPNPFSDQAIAQAEQAVTEIPSNQVNAGMTYTTQNGLEAEVEGEKDLGSHGWFLAGDATFSQRAKFAATVLVGWKAK